MLNSRCSVIKSMSTSWSVYVLEDYWLHKYYRFSLLSWIDFQWQLYVLQIIPFVNTPPSLCKAWVKWLVSLWCHSYWLYIYIYWKRHSVKKMKGCLQEPCVRWMDNYVGFYYSSITWAWSSHQKWRHFSRYWPFVRGIHRSPVNSPHKGQWRGALMFSLIWVWINGCVNNREAGDLRRHRANCEVIVIDRL